MGAKTGNNGSRTDVRGVSEQSVGLPLGPASLDADGLVPTAQLADYVGTTDPTANNDSADTAVLGVKFRSSSLWLNTTDRRLWTCRDATATAAVWELVAEWNTSGDQIFSRIKARLIALSDTATVPQLGELVIIVDNATTPTVIYGMTMGDGVTARGVQQTRPLASKITSTGNVGAGVDTLWSVTVTGNTLDRDAMVVRSRLVLTTAANANTKKIIVSFGGTTIFDSTALALNASTLEINVTIMRTGAATQRCSVTATSNSALLVSTVTYTATAITLANDAILLVTGEATADNDVVLAMGKLMLEPS